MGKIVKYCGSCEEGFAEKFTFCPDCGSPLQTCEMKPVAESDKESSEISSLAAASTEIFEAGAVVLPFVEETAVIDESEAAVDEMVAMFAGETAAVEVPESAADEMAATFVEETPVVEEPEAAHEIGMSASADGEAEQDMAASDSDEIVPTPAKYVSSFGSAFYQTEPMYADEPKTETSAPTYKKEDDGGYYVTVIQETNSKQRNILLLGAAALMLSLTITATIYSLFNKSLGIAAIDEGALFSAVIVDEIPMTVEEEKNQQEKDKGGGGGGGGRDEKDPTSQGQLASQTQKPLINPTKTIVQRDFELQQPIAATQGDRKMPRTDQPYGDPNARFAGLSDGTGTGGGQGSGFGQGQGSGNGTGMGSGSGSGSGSGIGNGNGSGYGPGSGGPPPSKPALAVTTPLRIISKPQARYNDEGRKNNVQGSVRLRVTLLASGQVGGITPVTRLPYGLTEQAIAAARRIVFEPKKVNGVSVPTTVVIDYSFTIY